MSACNQNDYRNSRQSQIYSGRDSRQMNLRSDCNMPIDRSMDYDIDSFPIAMAYVPWQKWQNIYEPHEALKAGTLFRDLDLRFYGVRGCHKK